VVSKALPMVSMVAWPLPGAVQDHQTEWPPALPAWLGSPVSLVAPTLVPVCVEVLPLIVMALAKLSLAGPDEPAGPARCRVMLPVAPPKPSTAMRYVVPATAVKATRLVWLPPPSSSLATVVRPATPAPLYSDLVVSKALPMVSMVVAPAAGAVQDHQTE